MAANKFVLKGCGVEVDYTIGVTPGIPTFIYKDEKISKDFPSSAVHTDMTELGNLVTVALEVTVDAGGITFSVFLPTFDVPRGKTVDFKTIGIYKEVRGPVILPAQQTVTWRTIQMEGTAETVIVPLSQPVAS
jgi:hypothetical protein